MPKKTMPTRLPQAVLLFLCSLSLSLASGCEIDCTGDPEAECDEGVFVNFRTELLPGTYLVEVDVPEGSFSCEIEYPDGNTSCSDASTSSEVQVDGRTIYISGTPKTISVRMTGQSSGDMAEVNFTPSYEQHGPNGTECPPTCPYDVTSMAAPSP